MFTWKKLGRVFDPTQIEGRPWLKEFAQAPSTLIFDDFVRVYFACRPLRDSNGQYVSYTGFVDLERNNLLNVIRISQNPIMDLGELGTFDEFGVYPTSVIKFGDDFLAYYAGWTRCSSVPYNVAIGAAISKDNGVTFKRVGKGPVISYNPYEPMAISGPKIRRFNDTWCLWYITGEKWRVTDGRPESVFKIRFAKSDDGFTWERVNKNIITPRLEVDECQASPDVIFHNNKYHMFFCYKYSSDFRNRDRGYRIGYASSADMEKWERDDSKAGIDISADGWDNEAIAYPHVFELDNKIYMLYLGNEVGRFGFGLAELEGVLA
jgi:hypothetical protein